MPEYSAVKVLFIKSDDWQALYLNGKCVQQGHYVRAEDVIEALVGKAAESQECEYLEHDELPEYAGRFPDECADVWEFRRWAQRTRELEAAL